MAEPTQSQFDKFEELDKFIVILADLLEKRRKMDQSKVSIDQFRYYYLKANEDYDRLVNMIADLIDDNRRLHELLLTKNV